MEQRNTGNTKTTKSNKEINKQKKKEDRLIQEEVSKALATLNEDSIRTFNGNPLLKRAGEKVELTEEHIKEYKRCYKDPIYFAEHYIKIVNVDTGLQTIKLYDYQKKMIRSYVDNRFNITLACRQSGKCCFDNTIQIVRHPDYTNGLPFKINMRDLYEWMKFRKIYEINQLDKK